MGLMQDTQHKEGISVLYYYGNNGAEMTRYNDFTASKAQQVSDACVGSYGVLKGQIDSRLSAELLRRNECAAVVAVEVFAAIFFRPFGRLPTPCLNTGFWLSCQSSDLAGFRPISLTR